jgi:hypothetical protein
MYFDAVPGQEAFNRFVILRGARRSRLIFEQTNMQKAGDLPVEPFMLNASVS